MTESTQEKIERLMKARGFSQKALSRAAGLNETAVHDLLKRHDSVRLSSLIGIAQALGVDVSYLVSDVADLESHEAELVRLMRQMTPEQQRVVLAMVETIAPAAPRKEPGDDQTD